MVIVVIIALWLIVVLDALKNSNTYLQKTRQKIVAINLAREWVEQVINIRNTNRQKRAGDKEKSWLKLNPSVDEWNDWLENDPWFGSGYYIILTTTMSGQQYFYAKSLNHDLLVDEWLNNSGNLEYSLCEKDWKRSACPGEVPQSSEWYFFRKIEWKWLFQKDSSNQGGEQINCPNGSDSQCSDDSAKEFRFCSIVEYFWITAGKVELCTILTNYEK